MARGSDSEINPSLVRSALLRRSINTDDQEFETLIDQLEDHKFLEIEAKSFSLIRDQEVFRDSIIEKEDYNFHMSNNQYAGYYVQEMRAKDGSPVFYTNERPLAIGKDPTFLFEDQGSRGDQGFRYTLARWLKIIDGRHCQDGREEWRNEAGNLHPRSPGLPAVIIEEDNGVKQRLTFLFYNDGKLLKRVVYEDQDAGRSGGERILKIFDDDGNLHSFNGMPSKVDSRGQAEWHERGEFKQEGRHAIKACMHKMHCSFHFREEEQEVKKYRKL